MKKSLLLLLFLVCAVFADPIILSFHESTNKDPVSLSVTIDQIQMNGNNYLSITADINEPYLGDIIALYVDFNIDQLPENLSADRFSVVGYDRNTSSIRDINTTVTISNNNVSLKGPYNMEGITSVFDAGVTIGTNGLKDGDIDPATLLINISGLSSPISMFDINKVGIRAQSLGYEVTIDKSSEREGSLKVVYVNTVHATVPEPAILTSLGIGVLVIALFAKRKLYR